MGPALASSRSIIIMPPALTPIPNLHFTNPDASPSAPTPNFYLLQALITVSRVFVAVYSPDHSMSALMRPRI